MEVFLFGKGRFRDIRMFTDVDVRVTESDVIGEYGDAEETVA